MKPITKLYLKTFLFTGIPYGIIMMMIDVLGGDGFRIWKFLFLTFFFGITMSITLVYFHRQRLKKNGIGELSEENLKVNQKVRIISNLNEEKLIEKLREDRFFRNMELAQVENGIKLSSGITWNSWGESITIIINSISQNQYEYEIISKPKLRSTVLDFGKNLENIDRIQKIIGKVA